MLMSRWSRTLLAVAAGLALVATSIAAKSEKKKEEPAAQPAKSIRVAIMPIVNGSAEVSAAKIMEDVLRDQLKEFPPERATFLQPTDTDRILSARDALARAYAINDRWSKYGTMDSTAIAWIDSLLMVDAILCVKVAEWENLRVTVIGRGESNTTVGFQFALFDVNSKKRLWYKDPREQRFAQEVDISSGSVNYDETGFIQSRQTTDPPRYEDLASDLVRMAFKKFPQK